MPDLRLELHALIDKIVDAIQTGTTGAEWVDQKTSPLGRARHCALVRSGALPGKKDGRRILVRRVDIEKYLERKTVIRVDEKADEDREAARVLATMHRKSA